MAFCLAELRSPSDSTPESARRLAGIDYGRQDKGTLEGTRMVSNRIRNAAPGNRLRVRIPCPPLFSSRLTLARLDVKDGT